MAINSEAIITTYWYVAIISTIVFILKTALPMDSGTEIDTDFTSITDTDASFHLMTIESISAFFMCTGWTGWVSFSILHYELKVAVIISIITGICGMVLFAWLLSLTKKMEQINTYDLNSLVDKTGKAYMHFEPKGNGKIQIEFNSKLDIIDAVSLSDDRIEAFSQIKVIKVENDVVYINKI